MRQARDRRDFIGGEFGPVRVAVICDGMGGMRGEDALEIVPGDS